MAYILADQINWQPSTDLKLPWLKQWRVLEKQIEEFVRQIEKLVEANPQPISETQIEDLSRQYEEINRTLEEYIKERAELINEQNSDRKFITSLRRSYVMQLLCMILLGVERFINESVPFLRNFWASNPVGASLVWTEITTGVSGAILYASLAVMAFIFLIYEITNRRTLKMIISVFSGYFAAMLIAYFLSGVSNLFYYLLFVPNGWRAFTTDVTAVTETSLFISGSIIAGSLLMVYRNPDRIQSMWFNRAFETALIVLGLAYGLVAWNFRQFGWLYQVFEGSLGVLLTLGGFLSLKNEKSLLEYCSGEIFKVFPPHHPPSEINHWREWINIRLPGPDDQRALQFTLNKAYPSSRAKTLASLIIFVIGGWIVLTVLGAILEWFVQNWLQEMFPIFK